MKKLVYLFVFGSLVNLLGKGDDIPFYFEHIISHDPKLIKLAIKNIMVNTNESLYISGRLDFRATNIIVESNHEPILIGKSNDMWLIKFK